MIRGSGDGLAVQYGSDECSFESYIRIIRDLAAYCATTVNTKYAPSDFPTAELSQTELDDVLAEFGES